MEETLLLPGCGLVSGLALLECNLGGGGRAGGGRLVDGLFNLSSDAFCDLATGSG